MLENRQTVKTDFSDVRHIRIPRSNWEQFLGYTSTISRRYRSALCSGPRAVPSPHHPLPQPCSPAPPTTDNPEENPGCCCCCIDFC
ncbi:hypothetical protein ElyMa_003997200 [Elysia marginata]|uniref:Uncharacterized protein n=1 Tax=Elysia marginata TaxID=1093978 RepID=A0AAV4FYY3_9GAST|nr:hypothetical protein ElyMa_003997200 [Elysia marginata]